MSRTGFTNFKVHSWFRINKFHTIHDTRFLLQPLYFQIVSVGPELPDICYSTHTITRTQHKKNGRLKNFFPKTRIYWRSVWRKMCAKSYHLLSWIYLFLFSMSCMWSSHPMLQLSFGDDSKICFAYLSSAFENTSSVFLREQLKSIIFWCILML